MFDGGRDLSNEYLNRSIRSSLNLDKNNDNDDDDKEIRVYSSRIRNETMAEIEFNNLSYCKMFLHLSKYPHLSCNGVLIGKKTSSQRGELIDIRDCVPLFHSSLGLAPGIEIALEQIDAYCEKKNLEIVGYYQANENANDNKPNAITLKYAEKLRENCPHSFVFMIDNNKIHPSKKTPFYKVYKFSDQHLNEAHNAHCLQENTFEVCFQALTKKLFQKIYDFDNHLDDVSCDWLNVDINKRIEDLINNIGYSEYVEDGYYDENGEHHERDKKSSSSPKSK